MCRFYLLLCRGKECLIRLWAQTINPFCIFKRKVRYFAHWHQISTICCHWCVPGWHILGLRLSFPFDVPVMSVLFCGIAEKRCCIYRNCGGNSLICQLVWLTPSFGKGLPRKKKPEKLLTSLRARTSGQTCCVSASYDASHGSTETRSWLLQAFTVGCVFERLECSFAFWVYLFAFA